MEVFSYLVIIVEALDMIDFAIAIQVMQFGDLIAAGDMDDSIHQVEQEGGENQEDSASCDMCWS